MKIGQILVALVFVAILSACGGPIVIPANVPVTWPPNQNFVISATAPPTAGPSGTPAPTAIPTLTPTQTLTLTPTATPTLTSTRTPAPTRKSPYPVAQGTQMIDPGFPPISVENIPQLKPVFVSVEAMPRHVAISTDGQKLFLTTSAGLILFNRKSETLAHWKNIFTADIECESCISVNRDGSRFAIITRNAGKWEAQVYDVQGDAASLILSLPVDYTFKDIRNEANVAISPNGTYLAFSAGPVSLRVLNLETKLPLFSYDRRVDGISFTPDGANLIVHGGRELLFFNTKTWGLPANLLLPREDTPYTFSPNAKLVAIALPTKMRVYAVENLKFMREINVPPSNADTREWQITFVDDKTLSGYAISWNDESHTNATVDTGQWDIESGKTLRSETVTSNSPDVLASLWGAALPLPMDKGDLEAGSYDHYNAFRFVSDGILLVNSPHSACWFKLATAETTCFKDPEHIMFATDGNTLKEVVGQYNTSLQDRSGATIIEVGTYRFEAINHTGEWAVINSGSGTNLYTKGKKLPQESVKGQLQGFSENAKLLVITSLEKENTVYLTIIDKTTGNTLFQKKDNFLYKPIIMATDGTIYYLQRDLDKNQTIINFIDTKAQSQGELTRLFLPAEPQVIALSSTGLLAIGQKDGSVLVITRDGLQKITLQAATSSINGLSFSPSGNLLAVACKEGVRVFAVLP